MYRLVLLLGLMVVACTTSRKTSAPVQPAPQGQKASSSRDQLEQMQVQQEELERRYDKLQQQLSSADSLSNTQKRTLEDKIAASKVTAEKLRAEIAEYKQKANQDKETMAKLQARLAELEKEMSEVSSQASIAEERSVLASSQRQQSKKTEQTSEADKANNEEASEEDNEQTSEADKKQTIEADKKQAIEEEEVTEVTLRASFFTDRYLLDDILYRNIFMLSIPDNKPTVLKKHRSILSIELKSKLDTFYRTGVKFGLKYDVYLQFEVDNQTYCGSSLQMTGENFNDVDIEDMVLYDDKGNFIGLKKGLYDMMQVASVTEGECND